MAELKNLKGEREQCPYCKSDNVIYNGSEVEGESLYYDVICQDCEKDYREYYNLQFNGNWGE